MLFLMTEFELPDNMRRGRKKALFFSILRKLGLQYSGGFMFGNEQRCLLCLSLYSYNTGTETGEVTNRGTRNNSS